MRDSRRSYSGNSGNTAGITGFTRGKKPNKRESVTFSFKAFTDTDADIIDFITGLMDGEKSEAIRAGIRVIMAGQALYPNTSEMSPFEELRHELREHMQHLQTLITDGANTPPALDVSPLNELRGQIAQLQNTLNALVQGGVTVSAPAPAAETETEATLSADDARRRREKMKAKRW